MACSTRPSEPPRMPTRRFDRIETEISLGAGRKGGEKVAGYEGGLIK